MASQRTLYVCLEQRNNQLVVEDHLDRVHEERILLWPNNRYYLRLPRRELDR